MKRLTPRPRRSQRGDTKLGCLFWLALVAAAGYVGWQVIPVKIQQVELANHIRHRSERTRPRPEYVKVLRREILGKAEELELPLDPETLKITATARRIRVECSYTVPINLIVYTWNWEHAIDSSTPVFDFSS